MIWEGCQGKKGVQIQEKICPNCGNEVEIMSSDVWVKCNVCGFILYSDLMDCVQNCPKARECVGDAYYERLMEAARQRQEQLEQLADSDEW